MYRALIVDDEPIAVKSIEYIINRKLTTVKVEDTARSGRSAIEKANSAHPDIIIMDINMPGINGLEAMRQIRRQNPTVRFIVISAFDYFDYAVEAVALNVDDYLLKPVKELKLLESLDKVVKQLDLQRDKTRQEIELKEKFEMITPILENGFINAICMFDDDVEDLRNYSRLFDFQQTGGYVIAIQFGEKESGEIKNKIGVGIKSQKLYQYYRGILKSVCTCIVGPIMLNRLIVYILDSNKSGFEQKKSAEKSVQDFYSRAEKLDLELSIGIGGYCQSIDSARQSYRQALRALQAVTASDLDYNILHFNDILEEATEDDSNCEQQFLRTFNLCVETQDEAKAVHSFEKLFSNLKDLYKSDFSGLKNKCISLIISLSTQWGIIEKNYSAMLGEIIMVQSLNELYHACCRCITTAIADLIAGKRKKINTLIQKANDFMEENFSTEITLDSIAKEVNLSPYYFSHFYKEETGINFIDHLVAIRVEKAKEYLSNADASVKDVAKQVGYSDPNYFSKLFKKITGLTATEFKEQCGKRVTDYVHKIN